MWYSRQNGIVVDDKNGGEMREISQQWHPIQCYYMCGERVPGCDWTGERSKSKNQFRVQRAKCGQLWWAARAHPLITSNESKYMCFRCTSHVCSQSVPQSDENATFSTIDKRREVVYQEKGRRRRWWNCCSLKYLSQKQYPTIRTWTRNKKWWKDTKCFVFRALATWFRAAISFHSLDPLPGTPSLYWFVRRRPHSRRTNPFLCRTVFYSWRKAKNFRHANCEAQTDESTQNTGRNDVAGRPLLSSYDWLTMRCQNGPPEKYLFLLMSLGVNELHLNGIMFGRSHPHHCIGSVIEWKAVDTFCHVSCASLSLWLKWEINRSIIACDRMELEFVFFFFLCAHHANVGFCVTLS